MELHADFLQRAVVHAEKLEWVASPMAGVDRRMLDRVGGEVARATSIVRYAPDSKFSSHVHTGGEEFLVLDGVFQDEHGDYPAGSYIRNPPLSRHTPGSKQGCTIFVKLWQFDLTDRTHVSIDTRKMAYIRPAGRPEIDVLPLFRDGKEDVRLERWSPYAEIQLELPRGGEFLVLGGEFSESRDRFTKLSWLRMPADTTLSTRTGKTGCLLWIKTGHLAHPLVLPQAISSVRL